jgi:hypothetical protein
MIIRNKFNGYGFDGTRLCHDPVSLSIAATQAGAASSAAAAALAAKTAAATTAATTAATAAAGKTAALELAKKEAITAGMKQAGTEAAKQATAEAVKQQVGTEVAKQGIAQAGQQVGTEAAKQGIFSANPAGMPPTAGAPITPAGPATTLPPAGNAPTMPLEQQVAAAKENAARELAARGGNVQGTAGQAADPLRTTYSTYPSQTYNPATGGVDNVMRTTSTPPFNAANSPVANPTINQNFRGLDAANVNKPFTHRGFDPTTNKMFETPSMSPDVAIKEPGLRITDAARSSFGQPTPKNALQQGFETGLQYVKDNPISTGLGLMTAGQYMNKPEEEDKDKYKNTVDMSEFKYREPTQPSFTRSYEYQGYAVGGPVEQMSNMNAVGANTGYPMASLQTPMYSNPAMQRPEATNVIAPSADASVDAYTGAARFAEGGLSAAQRREYGLSTRGQKGARDLSRSYEEMEEARQREAMKLFNESSLPTPRPIARSRTQELSSPFSAAQAEHARLGKKAKVPVIPMPKTNLGDIDNYMDIPIEAASGGIMHGLGGYSDGGRLLRGPGDGVSDSIPAVIGKRQPARLADGEFVIPARIVSELGNGSTEAGARKLYAMMERVQASRKKSIGKKKVAVNSKSDKHLPA